VGEVPFGRPRAEDVKASPAFVEPRREIWLSLKRGVRIEEGP
jgi:hypothetical protein